MKILAASCLHGDKRLVEKLANRAEKENVDLVVLAGDLTYGEQSTDGVVGPFIKRGKKVFLIPGNHETNATADFLAERYGAENIHGKSITYKGVGFFACGGANVGLFQLSENEIFYTLKKAFGKTKSEKKIMVTHVHPSDSIIAKFTHFVPGSTGVRRAIEELKPDVLICGHVHEAEGIEEKIGKTRVINVNKGKIIEV